MSSTCPVKVSGVLVSPVLGSIISATSSSVSSPINPSKPVLTFLNFSAVLASYFSLSAENGRTNKSLANSNGASRVDKATRFISVPILDSLVSLGVPYT